MAMHPYEILNRVQDDMVFT